MSQNQRETNFGHHLSMRAFQRIEHGLYYALALLLCATILLALASAASGLWQGLGDWTMVEPVFIVIDRLLVVLMLIEILHTVHVSVKSGVLTCEPFLVVGLIASIRRVLVITLESSQASQHGVISDTGEKLFRASMIEMGVLCVLIPVLVGSIYVLRRSRATPPVHSREALPASDTAA
ncbi:MAG TPA: phosphate-starvation-inducible PsiE family protein [Rhodopila sp.]|nr:phosphate-starvation-inducible PsiE family protein [Rhodopila sp.]